MKDLLTPIICCGCRKTIGYKMMKYSDEAKKPMATHTICPVCGPRLYPNLWYKANPKASS